MKKLPLVVCEPYTDRGVFPIGYKEPGETVFGQATLIVGEINSQGGTEEEQRSLADFIVKAANHCVYNHEAKIGLGTIEVSTGGNERYPAAIFETIDKQELRELGDHTQPLFHLIIKDEKGRESRFHLGVGFNNQGRPTVQVRAQAKEEDRDAVKSVTGFWVDYGNNNT